MCELDYKATTDTDNNPHFDAIHFGLNVPASFTFINCLIQFEVALQAVVKQQLVITLLFSLFRTKCSQTDKKKQKKYNTITNNFRRHTCYQSKRYLKNRLHRRQCFI